MYSIEEKLNNRLQRLIQFLVKREYEEDHVDSNIERVKLVKRIVSFQKRDKKGVASITLVLTFHPALSQFYEVLPRTHEHVLKSLRLHGALLSQASIASENPKTIRDKLILSKLKKWFINMLDQHLWSF